MGNEMKDLEKVKEIGIRVQHLVPDSLPKSGLKRMQYYVSFDDSPNIFHLGLSKGEPVRFEVIQSMVRNGVLVELTSSFLLPFDMDVWLSSEGEIVIASAVAPFSDNNRRVVARPRQFDRIYVEVEEQMARTPRPQIDRFTKVPQK